MTSLPRITLVTATLNRAALLEQTLRSVLDQGYPDLEYVVLDGGSTDDTPAVLRRHESRLARWTSGPDAGQYDAINRGFADTTGEVMGWINSDDLLVPWSLRVVGEVFAALPEVEWITSTRPMLLDRRGVVFDCVAADGYCAAGFLRGENLPGAGWPARYFIEQESTFWRRRLWERAGGKLDTSLRLAADFDLWARFFHAGAELHGLPVPLGAFRVHPDQKTSDHTAYVAEAKEVLRRHSGRLPRLQEATRAQRLERLAPARLRPLLRSVGLLHRRPLLRFDHRSSTWHVTS